MVRALILLLLVAVTVSAYPCTTVITRESCEAHGCTWCVIASMDYCLNASIVGNCTVYAEYITPQLSILVVGASLILGLVLLTGAGYLCQAWLRGRRCSPRFTPLIKVTVVPAVSIEQPPGQKL